LLGSCQRRLRHLQGRKLSRTEPRREFTSAESAQFVRIAGGSLQALSYGIVLWAMTLAPIAIVASLRETSVLFGAVIAILLLKEPLRIARVAAAVLVVCGLLLIRLQ
jgi:uncharacterized membrane protein